MHHPRLVSRALAAAALTAASWPASATPQIERISGYFCTTRHETLHFLSRKALGDSDEIAANAVNMVAGAKTDGRPACAYYRTTDAVALSDSTSIEQGIVFNLRSYSILPERAERWTGDVFGSLAPKPVEHEI